MTDYRSQFTGAQIDIAVSAALKLSDTLANYIPKTDIDITIPGLINGKIDIADIPLATTATCGIVQVGDGLNVNSEGKLTWDSTPYYTIDNVDNLLKGKATTQDIVELTEMVEGINNYSISIVNATVQDNPNIIYKQLVIQ
jgi:hypothetical protein